MKEYLRMADRFDGRVLVVDYSRVIADDRGHIGELDDEDLADYAADAINSHDELVAEVERLRDALRDMMEWTVKHVATEDCRPYNAAHKLLNK